MERRESLGTKSPVCHGCMRHGFWLHALSELACLRFTPSKNVYVFLICLFYPDDTSKDIYTTHHFDNFHLSFDPKLVHEGLQVFLHLNTVVFKLCFQLSQEKLRFKYD